MAVPVIRSLHDCADYTKTVEPFLPQLYALPEKVWAHSGSVAGLKVLYLDTNPLVSAFSASIAIGALCLALSELNRNYSQVDRLWSILPNLYVVHFAAWARLSGLPHQRLDLIAVATTFWSVSLHLSSSSALAHLTPNIGPIDIQLLAQGWLRSWV